MERGRSYIEVDWSAETDESCLSQPVSTPKDCIRLGVPNHCYVGKSLMHVASIRQNEYQNI